MNRILISVFVFIITIIVANPTQAKVLYSVKIQKNKATGWRYSDSDFFGNPTLKKIVLPDGSEKYAAVINSSIKDAKLIFLLNNIQEPIQIDKNKNGGIELVYKLAKSTPPASLSACLLFRNVNEKYKRATEKVNFIGKDIGNGWSKAIIPFAAFKIPANTEVLRVEISHNIINTKSSDIYINAISIVDNIPLHKSTILKKAGDSNALINKKYNTTKHYRAIFPMAVWFSDKTNKTYYDDKVYKSLYQSGFNIIGTPAYYPNKPVNHRKLSEYVECYIRTAKAIAAYPDMQAYPKIALGWDIDDPENKYSRMVWYSGYEQKSLVCPADENYWNDRVIPICLEYVKSSLKIPVFAIMLDWELYAEGKFRGVHGLCYCNSCWKRFSKQSGVKLPVNLPFKERLDFLRSKGVYHKYREVFYTHMKQLAKQLRTETDKVNPRLSYWVIPGVYTKFLMEVAKGLATTKSPVVISNEGTYTKPSSVLSDSEAIETNILSIRKDINTLQEEKIPFIYLGAIMPDVRPGYHALQAIAMAKECDGIWVWDQSKKIYPEGRDKFLALMKVANREIRQGTLIPNPEWKQTDTVGKINIPDGKQGVALSGITKNIFSQLNNSYSFKLDSLKNIWKAKLTVLQNFNAELPADSPIVKTLREYVRKGGRLFLTHDTGFFMSSPFPEIVVSSFVPKENGDGRHILDMKMKIAEKCLPAPDFSGKEFTASFNDHVVFKVGPEGQVLAYDRYGYPVIICGQFGKGKVIFSGNYYKKMKKDSTETKFIEELIKWLWN